jgi:D-arabinose 1-dehydrogenase-like Zn-dependent alcohol dehydrogenase
VFNSMNSQGVKAGSLVAIQGVGGLGHLAIQYANKMGFKVCIFEVFYLFYFIFYKKEGYGKEIEN